MGDRLHLVTRIIAGPVVAPFVNPVATDAAWTDRQPWSDAVTASASYSVAILPPLRADLTGGEPVRFRDLLVRCVAKDLSEGDLDLDLGRFGRPNLTFIESL